MTRSLVVDASLAFRLILPHSQRASVQTLLSQWKKDGYELCAPTLWTYEMISALCKMVYLKEVTSAEAQHALALIPRLGIQLIPPDDAQSRLAFEWTVRLNRGSAYDSFYLALAETLRCELWTADRRLHNALKLPWVRCLDGG